MAKPTQSTLCGRAYERCVYVWVLDLFPSKENGREWDGVEYICISKSGPTHSRLRRKYIEYGLMNFQLQCMRIAYALAVNRENTFVHTYAIRHHRAENVTGITISQLELSFGAHVPIHQRTRTEMSGRSSPQTRYDYESITDWWIMMIEWNSCH